MDFWGVEVKGGVPLEVNPGLLINIKQAALGETTKKEKGAKNIPLNMKIDEKDFVIGFLKPGKMPQTALNLSIDKKILLSHDWKNGSIYFAGKIFHDPDSAPAADNTTTRPGDSSQENIRPAKKAKSITPPTPVKNSTVKTPLRKKKKTCCCDECYFGPKVKMEILKDSEC